MTISDRNCLVLCRTKAQHMISLRTGLLAWGGRVWARAYIWVISR